MSHFGYGLTQVYTGNGKGKTTAALGEAIRTAAIGKKVGIVFFDKGGKHYSERKLMDSIKNIDYVATGRDRIDPITSRFDFSVIDQDRIEAHRGLDAIEDFFSKQYDLVIADEINPSTNLGMISVEDVLTVIEKKPEQTELILTGRNAPNEFIQKAHLVTEMRNLKHYYYSGVSARVGLDY